MDEFILQWWQLHPKDWHAHPYAALAALLCLPVGAAVLALAFWVKGKYWP